MTATVTFKLNGKDVTVPKGWTVMQAAKQESVEVPHFCWHEGLSVAGVCRFCMVKVEGRPKLEISCNLTAADGMVVSTTTDEVIDAHKWALEFHLINHPLDCPICDQAGECGLQDYYMKVGKYHSQMERPKVLKPKALDVGGDLVLDTERCILCSRCVRFEEEITKTSALGIFDRGDRAIVGTYPGKKIDHEYTTNLVDICPVGAFTSKDFRFQQRVWFLTDAPSQCIGCETACNTELYGKPETKKFFRIKPRKGEQNGHWMCDPGRETYRHMNREYRLLSPYGGSPRAKVKVEDALRDLRGRLGNPSKIALLVSAQLFSEEYRNFFSYFVVQLGIKNLFQWREPTENIKDFDGILRRGDHNANTRGLLQEMAKAGISAAKTVDESEKVTGFDTVIALAPELWETFPSIGDQLKNLCAKNNFVSLWSSHHEAMKYPVQQLLPTQCFAEKSGTTIAHGERLVTFQCSFPPIVENAKNVSDWVSLLKGTI